MNNNRIAIAQIISGFSMRGGVEWAVYEMVKNLDKSVFEPMVFCLCYGGELADNLKDMGIKVVIFDAVSSLSPKYFLRNLKTVWKLSRWLGVRKIDIVQTHEFFSGTIGRLAAILAGVPVIFLMLHNCDRWKRWYHILIDRYLAKKTDIIITNSNSVKIFTSCLEKIPLSKFKTIYNGIGLRPYQYKIDIRRKKKELNIEKYAPIICSIGRIAIQKGYRFLIESLPLVITEFPELRLLIVGGGGVAFENTEDEIKNLVIKLGVEKYVHFLGWRTDVAEILAVSDVFVLSSLWEGFGLSIVEAMAANKPVIATNVDAIPEVVSEGETGILVNPGDSKALGEAIIKLLKDPDKMRALGNAGNKRAFCLFPAEKMARNFERLYLSFYSLKYAPGNLIRCSNA